jgi:putative hydrolase of the HAD superfamily
MRWRAIFFDIGGVLESTPRTGWQERWEAQLALSPGELDERLAPLWLDGLIGRTTEQAVRTELAPLLDLADEQVGALMNELWQEYLGAPNTELIRYFASLRERLRTAIISNSFVGAREREEHRYGFSKMCEHIVYSHEVGIAKPDSRIFALACERLSVAPADSIFVDDVAENTAAATALGFHAILFDHTSQTISEIEAQLRF